MTQSPTPYGIINLHKPQGPTSHDMVALVRKRLGLKGVGHAGTLDPMATGVLVIGVGPATRLMTFLGEQPKEYIARLILGRETDSQDITGVTLREASAVEVTAESLEQASGAFRGPILQIPPMVSAIRKDGRRLYELAREGKTVERAPRPVTVYSLDVLEFIPGEKAEAVLRIQCSGGFYVRTLCADLGAAFGCGGCMAALVRTAVGPFRLEDSVLPDQVTRENDTVLLPPTTAVAHLPRVELTPEGQSRVQHGNVVETGGAGHVALVAGAGNHSTGVGNKDAAGGEVVRLENSGGQLVAIARTLEGETGCRYQPFLVLLGG